jgi:hypothetical protein
MKKQILLVGLTAIGVGATFSACGGGGEDGATSDTGGAGNAGGAGGTNLAATGGTGGTGFGIGGSSSGTNSGAGGDESCAGEKSTAELVPLDMYIMLDASGSMNDGSTSTVSKWDAVTQALSTFFTDPQSSGLGAGLQYFPLQAAGVPDSCTNNAQCGTGGPCLFRVCTGQPTITACVTNADCPGTSRCVDLGECANTGDLCAPAGNFCGGADGFCAPLTESVCAQPDSCTAGDYATPAVEIAPLSGATATVLIESINGKDPEGATPTASALSGAIEHAGAYALAHPGHKVVAVLATDGVPTECSPLTTDGIAQIASAGLAASPSISTFVIGVFAGDDMSAQSTMNTIAEAGGTSQAFIVDASQDVSQAFLDALTAIRGTSLACEYQMPVPADGQVVDFGKVNVEYTPASAADPTTILYVTNAEGCDPMTGGWYYDIDPASGGIPTKLVMCPSTCTLFSQGEGGEVNISVGCKTEIASPL